MARRRERPTPCSPDDTLSWVESRTGQGEEGTSELGSNDLDGGGGDNSDGQDGEESGSESKLFTKANFIKAAVQEAKEKAEWRWG